MTFHVKMNLEENWKFTCDCELCANDDFLDTKTMLKIFDLLPERNFGFHKEFDKARKYLKEAWIDLNTKPFLYKGFSPHMLHSAQTLEAIAYNLSIPFRLNDP